MVAPLILAGVGVSMATPAVQNAVLSSVAVVEIGKVSGIFNMGRFLGGVFGGLAGGLAAKALGAQRGALNVVFACIIVVVAVYMLARSLL